MYEATSTKNYDRVTCIAHGRSFANLASKTSIFHGEILCSTESILAATSGDRPLTVVRNQSHQAYRVLTLNTTGEIRITILEREISS